jgi:hypothetical protein
MTTQKLFWNMVDNNEIIVVNRQICVDALKDTPTIDIQEFLDEAEEYGWIEIVDVA